MTKTPEELAEKYIDYVLESHCDVNYKIAFVAGYEAGNKANVGRVFFGSSVIYQFINNGSPAPKL